jgi:hypothetical protein
MKPKVYFKSLLDSKSRQDCLSGVLNSIQSVWRGCRESEIVGIKITIGDSKDKGYIKPELIRLVVNKLKTLKLKPFCFDTNVIYKGVRMNAVDHLNLAYERGFDPEYLGCPFIIADGVFGSDSKRFKVDPVRTSHLSIAERRFAAESCGANRINQRQLKEISVPSLITILDNLVVISHITGHMLTGYAASIKNVGMGMASRAGKQIQHSSLKPHIVKNKCTLCGRCIDICPTEAISQRKEGAFINQALCVGCGECISACKFDAVYINWKEDVNMLVERMAEYAWGVISKIKRKVFFNFAFDITKECDCIAGDDPKIINDTGIFTSSDILAVDKACFDVLASREDMFAKYQNTRAHLHQFDYAKAIGLGNLEYELIRL